MEKPVYVIDGNNFSDLEGLYDEVEKYLIPFTFWGRNLDALNDILRGDFGPLPRAFILVWKNMSKSRLDFGYEATIKFWHEVIDYWTEQVRILEEQFQHPEGKSPKEILSLQGHLELCKNSLIILANDLEMTQRHEGTTIFDWIMEMILDERKQLEFRPE